jgi:hypothetical protein
LRFWVNFLPNKKPPCGNNYKRQLIILHQKQGGLRR